MMRSIRRRDTKPEKALRSLLHREGLRFRVDMALRTSTGLVRPDVVFTKARLAVFVDGCYWHGCPEHGRVPKVNASYWGPKLARNVERDRANTAALEENGWTVLRFWEHRDVEHVAAEVRAVLRALGDQ